MRDTGAVRDMEYCVQSAWCRAWDAQTGHGQYTVAVRDGEGRLAVTEEQKAGRRAEVRCWPG